MFGLAVIFKILSRKQCVLRNIAIDVGRMRKRTGHVSPKRPSPSSWNLRVKNSAFLFRYLSLFCSLPLYFVIHFNPACWLKLLTYIREVSISNPGRDTNILTVGFRGGFQPFQENAGVEP
jgi:hypothetical protein